MFGIQNYLSFIGASILLHIVPGTDVTYILTRSVAQGRQAGIASALGILTGCLVHILCTAFGLSWLLAQSTRIFAIIKGLGAVYLVFLGVQTLWKSRRPQAESEGAGSSVNGWKLYRQGVIIDATNPKMVLFFVSFLPQFIRADAAGPLPFLVLGGTFLTTASIWCFFLALAASSVTGSLRRNPALGTWLQRVSGLVFIALGIKLLF